MSINNPTINEDITRIVPINPRVLLKQKNGFEQFYQMLVKSGYVPQQIAFRAIINAILRRTPILFEGHRGGGKTAFPEAIAKALNLPIYVLSCLDDTSTDEILFSWDRAGQAAFVAQETAAGIPYNEVKQKQWTFDFLNMGEVLDAFHFATKSEFPPILLIDEIDKLSTKAETALLQILARGYANIPNLRPDARIGFVPEYPEEKRKMLYPIVVLTSNNMGSGVSSPLLSRTRFTVIPPPDLETIIKILARRVPEASPILLYQSCKLVWGLMGQSLIEKPALREFIELVETFHEFGYKHITADIIRENLDCVAKTEKDLNSLLTSAEMLFADYVEKEDETIKAIVGKIVSDKKRGIITL